MAYLLNHIQIFLYNTFYVNKPETFYFYETIYNLNRKHNKCTYLS